MDTGEICFRLTRKSLKRKRSVFEDDLEKTPLFLKFNNSDCVMRNGSMSKRCKPKSRDSYEPGSLQHIKFIEIKRKSSISDSNDSTASNSPPSSDDNSASMGHSEVDEMNMLDMDMDFSMENDLNKIESSIPLISQAISIQSDVFKLGAHSLPKTTVIKSSLKNRTSPYSTSLQNTYATLGTSPTPAPTIQYRGGRKKEAPPPVMTEEERRQWEKERLKKDNHNIIEKRRRYKINDCITEIGRLLPPVYDVDILNKKGTILQTAIEHIKQLHADQLAHKQLQMKCETLETINKQLKEALMMLKSSSVEGLVSENSFQSIQDVNLGLFDISADNQSIKQEQSLLKDVGAAFTVEQTPGQLDFARGLSLHPQDVLCDNFIFLKSEQEGESLLNKTAELSAAKDPEPYTINNVEETFNLQDHQQALSDHISSAFTMNFPCSDSMVHPGLYFGNPESLNCFSNMFMEHEQLDSNPFADIPDGNNAGDFSLYPLIHSYDGLREEDLTLLN